MGGGQQLLSQLRIFDQHLHPPARPTATPHSPPPLIPESPLRLIKLDQDDTNNWLKLEPVHRPNDPYLTPFVAMVSLFPRRAPFGTVYLGSVASVLAPNPPIPLPNTTARWHHESDGKVTFFADVWEIIDVPALYGHPIHPFCSISPWGAHAERADEVFWCEMFLFDINVQTP